MFKRKNKNPLQNRVGDCTVRAISEAMGLDWDCVYINLCIEGFIQKNMPTANVVWGEYLRKNGFVRRIIPTECANCYTVERFCDEHPRGTFILATENHVLCAKNGCYIDTWDSGEETPIYFWQKEV